MQAHAGDEAGGGVEARRAIQVRDVAAEDPAGLAEHADPAVVLADADERAPVLDFNLFAKAGRLQFDLVGLNVVFAADVHPAAATPFVPQIRADPRARENGQLYPAYD